MKMFSGCWKEGTGLKPGKIALSRQWSTPEVIGVQISAETGKGHGEIQIEATQKEKDFKEATR